MAWQRFPFLSSSIITTQHFPPLAEQSHHHIFFKKKKVKFARTKSPTFRFFRPTRKMESKSILAALSPTFSTTTHHHLISPLQLRNRSNSTSRGGLQFSLTSRNGGRPRGIYVRSEGALRDNVTGSPASVPVRVAYDLLLAGHRYLDVRTPEEFSAGHAAGAINIPYMYRVGSGMTRNPKFLDEVSAQFEKHDEIIVGCQSGKRSMMAATDLLSAGFTGVTDIAGGFAAWSQNQLPTEG